VRSKFAKVLASPRMNDTEIWELRNPSGGWHHPLHIHFIDFKVLTRNGAPPMPYELGAKDVVFLGENESVRVLIKFEKGRGKYMMHCHNLVHEDHDMMAQFQIVDAAQAAPDPLSERAVGLPEVEL
jgi:spore coat protein A, manganese oxidase